jgi:hypothetical protein
MGRGDTGKGGNKARRTVKQGSADVCFLKLLSLCVGLFCTFCVRCSLALLISVLSCVLCTPLGVTRVAWGQRPCHNRAVHDRYVCFTAQFVPSGTALVFGLIVAVVFFVGVLETKTVRRRHFVFWFCKHGVANAQDREGSPLTKDTQSIASCTQVKVTELAAYITQKVTCQQTSTASDTNILTCRVCSTARGPTSMLTRCTRRACARA